MDNKEMMKNLVEQFFRQLPTILYFFIFLIMGCTPNNDQEKLSQDNTAKVEPLNVRLADYEIVGTEDQSRKALGNKLLSEHTISEIEHTPTNKKMLYKVVFASGTQEKQIRPTIEKAVNKLIQEDNDIDEIILFLYSDKSLSAGPYDIGTATWAPLGKLGNVTSEIAQSNNRENYAITYDIKNNLEEYLIQRSKSENKFGLTEEERRQFFKDYVAAEGKASSEVKKYKINDPVKYYDKEAELMAKYRADIRKKYDISEEQASEISDEAFREEWPLR